MARKASGGAELDMTPMIDCVFQLIIFFVVTMKMNQDVNTDIKLEDAPHGVTIKEEDPLTTVIEVDRRGWISMHNAKMTKGQLRSYLQSKFNKYRTFPVLIRGDGRTQHQDIRAVMDICTSVGLWKINFAAIKERKNKQDSG